MDIKEFASMGGRARMSSLTPEARKTLARKAINTRWNKNTSKLVSGHQVNKYNGNWCDTHNRSLAVCKLPLDK